LGARAKHTRNILVVVFLVLLAAGVAFVIEKSFVQNGVEAIGHIIAKRRIPHAVGSTSDPYEIIIEYQVNDQRKRLVTSRAVWDSWGKVTLNTIGATVPVWHLDNGQAFIDRFNYLYPITATLLGLTGIGLVGTLFVFLIPQSRYERAGSRVRRYQHTKKTPYHRISNNRKLLLKRMHQLFIVLGAIVVLAVIGILRESAWLYITVIAGVILLAFAGRRALVCPHCGASLKKDLQKLDPLLGRTNWMIVRDNLAKGVAVICSKCGCSLDD